MTWGSAARGPFALAVGALPFFASPGLYPWPFPCLFLALVDASNVTIQEDAVLRVTLLSTKHGTCDLGENVG